MAHRYILDEHGNAIEATSLRQWARWFERSGAQRRLRYTTVGKYEISTAFLALDHSFGEGPPLLWETMVFVADGAEGRFEHDVGGLTRRYSSKEAAWAGHDETVKTVQGWLRAAANP